MQKQPLISVIIPCYNQGGYLRKAIESIIAQTYKHHEIIVIDDGSTDYTRVVSGEFSSVKYIYQNNQGPSSARNTGIDHCNGDFIIFLDADDWLLPGAFEINLSHILQHPELAFVSGAYQLFHEQDGKIVEVKKEVKEKHYCQLLQDNYIDMIATVMFQKWIFDLYRYDVSIRGCEDYDLYLKIARKYPVLKHNQLIAVYRIHSKNNSENALMMLETALLSLNRQKEFLINGEEKKCLQKGQSNWKNYYSGNAYVKSLNLLYRNNKIDKSLLKIVKKYNQLLYFKFLLHQSRKELKNIVPSFLLRRFIKSYMPSIGRVKLGDFNRTSPFSTQFGYDRGGPVDRYYIENFLEINAYEIKGRVLEIGDNEYTLRFGGSKIMRSDILDIYEKNHKANYIGDLSNAPVLIDDTFDCIILTQTLQYIYDYQKALATCYRILKPGGVLLLTVPGISNTDHNRLADLWLWTFTGNSIMQMLTSSFSFERVVVETNGNVMIATGFLYGMGLSEFTRKQLDENDPHYQLVITAKATK